MANNGVPLMSTCVENTRKRGMPQKDLVLTCDETTRKRRRPRKVVISGVKPKAVAASEATGLGPKKVRSRPRKVQSQSRS